MKRRFPGLVILASFFSLAGCASTRVVDRASCSSLCQAKQPLDKTLKVISDMGFKYVDLSCLPWAPHISVPAMEKDFEAEAKRVESALATYHLRVSNLTFDPIEARPWDVYEKQFRLVVKMAERTKARLINIMAPSTKADRQDQVAKLRQLQAIAAADGIILTVETHCNQITEQPADAIWLCRQVPGLGLTLDPSHYYAGPYKGGSLDELYPYVQGTGLRAGGDSWATIQMPWGEGPIDFVTMVRKLEACGYKGFYVVEYIEGFNKLDPLVESRKFLEWAAKQ